MSEKSTGAWPRATRIREVVGAPADGVPWPAVLLALTLGSVVVVATSWVTLEFPPHPFFAVGGGGHAYLNVGAESNVPTWWSTAMLVTAGAGLAVVGWLSGVLDRGRPLPWLAVAGVVLALALDEAVEIHEQLYRPASAIASGANIPYVWLVLGVPLALAVVVTLLLLARRLPRPTRRLLGAGILVFFAGAIGMEGVGSMLQASGRGHESSLMVAAYHVEELLEMLGAGLLVVAPLAAVRLRRTEQGAAIDVGD